MIKAALFDLDETLLARRDSLTVFLSKQWDETSSLQEVDKVSFTEVFLKLDDNGRVWKDIVYKKIVDRFSLAVPASALLDNYIENFSQSAKLFPYAMDVLSRLRNRGFALGIISNGRHDFQMSVIEELGLIPLMDVVLISESEKIRKPDPVIFHRALSKVKIMAADAVFIGDNPDADIAGAKAAGLKTLWFRTTLFPPPAHSDGIISGFNELETAIDELL